MVNRALVLGLGLIAAGAAGCNGGASEDLAPPATNSGSFSPTNGTTAAGATTDVWWKHRMNGGVAMPIVSNGMSGTMTMGDRLTKLTNGGTQRQITFAFTVTLSDGTITATSHATNEIDDTLMAGPPSALVAESVHQEQQASAPGFSEHVTLQEMLTSAMPTIDFGDRADLDQLPVGHVEEATSRVMVTGTATASAPGVAPQTNTETAISDEHFVWTVTGQMPSMTVLGKTYERVVEVQLRVDATDTATLMTTSQTETDWLAAGIGTIKSQKTGDNLLGTAFTAELIDTNLGSP
jgi:hypothetical protein